jgi:lysophospholipase L1-like esterase
VLSKNPDIVVIYIGVNDVWHKRSTGTGTDADKFEKFYKALIAKIQAKNALCFFKEGKPLVSDQGLKKRAKWIQMSVEKPENN